MHISLDIREIFKGANMLDLGFSPNERKLNKISVYQNKFDSLSEIDMRRRCNLSVALGTDHRIDNQKQGNSGTMITEHTTVK